MSGTVLGQPTFAPPPAPNETTRLSFVGADGTEVVFTNQPALTVMPGIQGLGDLPYSLLADEVPALDGQVFKGVRATARDVFIPLYIEAPTRPQLLAELRTIVNALDPRNGPGQLHVTQPDGSGRRLGCYYISGMEGDEGRDAAGLRWQTHGITLRALEPAWLDEVDIYFRWIVGVAAPFFPLLPANLGESQIIGQDLPIDNVGDEPAYPTWTLHGKMTSATLTNATTGEALTLDHVQTTALERAVIDTRPGIKTVVDEAGTNLWPQLAPNPRLWPLVRGTNIVNLTIAGTDASSYVEMSFTPRYKMAG